MEQVNASSYKSYSKRIITSTFDKPIHMVEEAIDAGISEIIFVTRSGKEATEDHFDVNLELEYLLERKGKKNLLNQ